MVLLLLLLLTGFNTDKILKSIDKLLSINNVSLTIKTNSKNGKLINWLYNNSDVKNIIYEKNYGIIDLLINPINYSKLTKNYNDVIDLI